MKVSEVETMKQEIESSVIAFKQEHTILSLAQFFKHYHDFKETLYNYVTSDEWVKDSFETHAEIGQIDLDVKKIKTEIEAECGGNVRLEKAYQLLEYEN